jgi:amino acid transporter
MEAPGSARRDFDHLREHSIGLPGGLYVYYAMARNGIAPKQLARTHPRFKTPHVAILLNMAIALFLSFALGWKWGPLNGFIMLATAATVVVILVYMLVMAGSIRYNLTVRVPALLPVQPAARVPDPLRGLGRLDWVIAGLVGGAIMQRKNPAALKAAQRISVADEVTGAAPEAPAVAPAS